MRSNGSKRPSAGVALPQAVALGGAIRARRRKLRLGQIELCELAGVGPAFLYQLEHGKPTVRLDKLLPVLHVLGLELQLRPGHGSLVVEPPADGGAR